MNKTINALNNYFFGDEEISLSDGLWFYGSTAGVILITIFIVLIGFIN